MGPLLPRPVESASTNTGRSGALPVSIRTVLIAGSQALASKAASESRADSAGGAWDLVIFLTAIHPIGVQCVRLFAGP